MRVYSFLMMACCSVVFACGHFEHPRPKTSRTRFELSAYTEQDKQVLSGQASEKTQANALIDIVQAKSEKHGAHVSKLRDFLAKGVDPNVQTDDVYKEPISDIPSSSEGIYINTPLQQAIYNIPIGFTKLERDGVALELLRYKAHVDTQNSHGDTALHIAVKSGCFDSVSLLLAFGASANIVNNNGEKPEDCAGVFKRDPRPMMHKSYAYQIRQALTRYIRSAREKQCYALFIYNSGDVPDFNFSIKRIGKVAMGQGDFNGFENLIENPDMQFLSIYQELAAHAAILEDCCHSQAHMINEYRTYIENKLMPDEKKQALKADYDF